MIVMLYGPSLPAIYYVYDTLIAEPMTEMSYEKFIEVRDCLTAYTNQNYLGINLIRYNNVPELLCSTIIDWCSGSNYGLSLKDYIKRLGI